jgi:hypothetical protein
LLAVLVANRLAVDDPPIAKAQRIPIDILRIHEDDNRAGQDKRSRLESRSTNDGGMVAAYQLRVRIIGTNVSLLTPQENQAQRRQQRDPPYMPLGTRHEASCPLFVLNRLNHDD